MKNSFVYAKWPWTSLLSDYQGSNIIKHVGRCIGAGTVLSFSLLPSFFLGGGRGGVFVGGLVYCLYAVWVRPF